MSKAPLLLKRSRKCNSQDLVLGEEHTAWHRKFKMKTRFNNKKKEYVAVGVKTFELNDKDLKMQSKSGEAVLLKPQANSCPMKLPKGKEQKLALLSKYNSSNRASTGTPEATAAVGMAIAAVRGSHHRQSVEDSLIFGDSDTHGSGELYGAHGPAAAAARE
jgi:hypothetical protein